mmetsp:Transcript_15291/g.25859  ORF Transcript_15291/g.25859 Transcript_15291/m.25859 type:complete len:99 (+) Transcript_15291:178-474(+)
MEKREEVAHQLREESSDEEVGILLNYGSLLLAKHVNKEDLVVQQPQCPKCRNQLVFGFCQTQCFSCFSQLALCQSSFQICTDEMQEAPQIVKCDLCQS